jgi:thiol:disulfide interchange protein DsbD
MKSFFLILSFFLTTSTLFAQPVGWQEKVKWSFKVEKIDDTHANIIGTAKLLDGWHIFSVDHDPEKADFTGVPTTFNLKSNKDFKVIGKLKDGKKAKVLKDDLGTQLYFEGTGVFKQEIEVLTDKPFKIPLAYSFQICDEAGCVFPPEQEVVIDASGFKPVLTAQTEEPEETSTSVENSAPNPNKTIAKEKIEPEKKTPKKDSNLVIFIAGFLAGLIALFTPCMFPMIPMTVTFFTKQSKTRSEGIFKALIYGASIVLIYVTFGLIFTAATGPLGLNDLSTNVWMNLIFFSIFVLFAFSFLGAFEIQLPSSWVNKMDKQADKGGLIGIFFMAFTLGLVSFSCTGPIIGSLLVEAATSGSYLTPAIGMTGFSLALAIPFTLFAIFPGWLNSLPQSGGWLNSVKVVLGLLELALALKFLSAVDLAYHWDLLTREWFVAIWFVLFLIMGIYLLGKIRFSHDSPVEKLSVPRFMFALMALSFAVYLYQGMLGAPLKIIDGIAPPRTHSEDNFRYVNGGLETGIVKDSISEKYISEMHPVGDGSILVFHDLQIAKEYAKAKNLPILLDFTGHACQNCRKMESTVWTSSEIRPILQTKVVIASLYCDDKTPLPASEVRYSDAIGGKIKTIGNKWAELQIVQYKSFQQPLYVMIDAEGNDLTEGIGYTPDIPTYKKFLEKGIKAFKK